MFDFNVISAASGTTELVSGDVTYTTMCGTPEHGKATVIMALAQVDNVTVRVSGATYTDNNEIFNTDFSK